MYIFPACPAPLPPPRLSSAHDMNHYELHIRSAYKSIQNVKMSANSSITKFSEIARNFNAEWQRRIRFLLCADFVTLHWLRHSLGFYKEAEVETSREASEVTLALLLKLSSYFYATENWEYVTYPWKDRNKGLSCRYYTQLLSPKHCPELQWL